MRRVATAFVLVTAAALRLWGLGDIPAPLWDEWLHVPTAHNYLRYGLLYPDDWWHPPMRHLIRAASMAVLGDTPLAYRLPNALLGTLAVVLIVLVVRRLGAEPWAALLAGALLAGDPLHLLLSRTTPEEIAAGTALLAALWFALRAVERPFPGALGVGFALGAAMATKWYYAPAGAAIAGAVAWRGLRREASPARVAYLAAALLALPVSVYVLSYLPWFAAGHDLAEFIRLQLDAARMVRLVREDMGSPVFFASKAALDWFTRPLAMGIRLPGPGTPRHLLFLTAFPATLLVLPATAAVAWSAWRMRSLARALAASSFALTFGQFLLLRRPIYVYSAGSVLPLAWILVALAASDLLALTPRARPWVLGGAAALALAAGIGLFPLLSGGRPWCTLHEAIVARAAVLPGF